MASRLTGTGLKLPDTGELVQTNLINFPEDYEASEIEEKKNQIREIREKIDAAQNLEELSQIDLNIIPLPEPEELTE